MQPRDLRKLVKVLAAHGVSYFRCGDIELKFTPDRPTLRERIKEREGKASYVEDSAANHIVDASQTNVLLPLPVPPSTPVVKDEPLTPDEATHQFDLQTDRKRNRHYYENPALWVGGKKPSFPAKGSLHKENS